MKYLLIGMASIVLTIICVFLFYTLVVLTIACIKRVAQEVRKNDRDK